MKTSYDKQAEDFAKKHGIELFIDSNPSYGLHFPDDKEPRYIFDCTLTRNGEHYRFDFGQSLNSGAEEPTMYDILTCLQKYDVGSFEDFCGEFGYGTDSRSAEDVYNAVCHEFTAVERLFSDIIDELAEIQ